MNPIRLWLEEHSGRIFWITVAVTAVMTWWDI